MSLLAKIVPATLSPILDKVRAGERVTDQDAALLYECNDLNALGGIANIVRECKNGNVAHRARVSSSRCSTRCARKADGAGLPRSVTASAAAQRLRLS